MKNRDSTPEPLRMPDWETLEHPRWHSGLLTALEQELSNAVTVMSGWVQWVERPDCEDLERKKAAKNTRGAINRLRTALRCMSMGPKQTFSHLAIIDLNELVTSALRALDPRVREAFDVRWSREPELASVIGDAAALEHVVVNLIMDAANAGQPGDRIIVETSSVQTTPFGRDADGEEVRQPHVQLVIRTQAIGPRAGVEAAGAETTSGALWVPPICNRIVQEHAGALRVASCPDSPRVASLFLPTCHAVIEGRPSRTEEC